MDELTRKALVEQCENIIADVEARQLDSTDWEGLNYEELKCISECLQFGQNKTCGTFTGLFDKNSTPIRIGDKTRLVLDDGDVREFDVCFKTVTRTVKCHPDFDDEYSKVAITGVVFCWNGYDLFPCVDECGIMDTSKMEVILK